SERALEGDRARARRNVDILREFAARAPDRKQKRLALRFLVSPVRILGENKVEGIEIVHNELVEADGSIRAVPTERTETIPCGLVLRSGGYQGVSLPGVPFDERRAVIPNEAGRVEPGIYTAGWIKRGPSGVIGTNKKDAVETVESLLADAEAGLLSREDGELE